MRVYLTPTASRELEEISDRIALDRPSASEKWLRETFRLFEILAAQPEAGERVHTRSLGSARRVAHGNYIIYYRPLPNGAEVLRVIHGARDQDKLV
ncbi:MAG: type II toxin-antitoxin system RelE/ParE family toxin [Planctomycetaceae bacterium]|nr:type II toxin-antitoxin system RelE/ParE family toxin [Planctomycetaceae bacterium]